MDYKFNYNIYILTILFKGLEVFSNTLSLFGMCNEWIGTTNNRIKIGTLYFFGGVLGIVGVNYITVYYLR